MTKKQDLFNLLDKNIWNNNCSDWEKKSKLKRIARKNNYNNRLKTLDTKMIIVKENLEQWNL